MAKNDFCIIMGGGIGSRFWPVSREHKPKQFLDFFGTGETLLQQTYRRVKDFIPKENIFIVTNEIYVQEILVQLPELQSKQILREPTRRNTAPCIAYAMLHILALCPEANLFITPADHIILNEKRYTELVTKALNYVSQNDVLVTLGIKPHCPETGYGYVQMDKERQEEGFMPVKLFTEKPTREIAEIFIDSGDFLWNSGMFVWSIQTIYKAFVKYAPEILEVLEQGGNIYATEQEAEFIEKNFSSCPKISIDYAIMEKSENVWVLPSDFGWADLGTWKAIHEVAEQDIDGNVSLHTKSIFSQAHNNLVHVSSPDRIVVVHGVSNCIIAEEDNVLLICDMDDEQRVKTLMKSVELEFGKDYV